MTVDLKHYWPSGEAGGLMKAAFHSDMEIAARAWRSWLETCDFDRAFWGDLRIASLAHRRFGGSGFAGALAPRLQGLRRYVWSAGQMKIDAARPLLTEFAANNVTFMPIKGSVLLARDPQAMTDRYITDVDVLVDHDSWEKAVEIAFKEGWSSVDKVQRSVAIHRMRQTHHALELQRGKQGAVDLHQFSLLLNRQLGADAMLWERSSQGSLSGIPVLLPHPSDHLAIVFGHCFLFSMPRTYNWVADALATISTPGFDWHLFTDVVLDRNLAVPAATALTYLAEELQWEIPEAVISRISAQVQEPFLSEFSGFYRTEVPEIPAEWRAIYQAECIRSRHFIERVSLPRKVADRQSRVNATLNEIKTGQTIALPMPSGVKPTDRIQFRLQLEAAEEWRNASSLVTGTSALVLLRCFDFIPLELGRLLVWRKNAAAQELKGEIDGALVVGRGIDELWLKVTIAEPFWKLRGVRARILEFARKGPIEAGWLQRLRGVRAQVRRLASKGPPGSDGANEPQATVLRGNYEATISRPA
jgi:Uncharacterised nucleotidyltransferase